MDKGDSDTVWVVDWWVAYIVEVDSLAVCMAGGFPLAYKWAWVMKYKIAEALVAGAL